jgi:kumamolisin
MRDAQPWGKENVGSKPELSPSAYLISLICLFLLITLIAGYFSFFQYDNAHASGTVPLLGHVPALIQQSQLLGPTDPNTSISLTIGLRLRNQATLQAYVNNATHPHVTMTRRYLTPDQVTSTFGPLPSSTQAVMDYMQKAGFTVTTTYKQHLLIDFHGTIGQAEQAFQVQINNYRAPSGRIFYATPTNPSVPSTLAGIIQSVSGLDNATQFSHPPVLSPKQLNAQARVNANCAGAGQGYTPSQIASAYNLNGLYNAGFHGEGQIVALYELDDYAQSDISAYTACYGGASVPISRISIAGGISGPGSDAIEVELDMELILSAAPRLAGLRIYEAPNSDTGALDAWAQIISDAVPIVSTSWGACEPVVTQSYATLENDLLMVAIAQGQSIFVSSGDHGTNDCIGTNGPQTTETVDDPASQPYVTAVGGTSLAIGANNSYGGETVWQGISNGFFVGSGGGISSFWAMPNWQQGSGVISHFSSQQTCVAYSGGKGYCREVPDVALNADPNTGYPVYCTVKAANCSPASPWSVVGGTSAAAPLWAAMNALANEKSLHDGNFNLGFLNPLLYQIEQNTGGTSYANDFHDITSGSNSAFNDGKYPAGPGYDMATGLGSYNALALAGDLETLAKNRTNARIVPANTTWYFAEGSVGGTFSEYITLLNPSINKTATVTITYLFEYRPAVTIQHTVNASSRYTVSANGDLNISPYAAQQAISAIVRSTIPIVAERPMYFNHVVASGTDAIGATNATHTTFYFAESDTRQDATRNYHTYLTILNPSTTQTAKVTITYYNQGRIVGTEPVSVGPLQRGTGTPAAIGIYQQTAVKVTSNIGIVVERPLYFRDNIPNAGGQTTGAATAVGATNTAGDWLFAEGYTGAGFQEYLVLANFGSAAASVNVKLEYSNGTTQVVPITVPALSQYYFDVNNAHSNPAAGCNCTPTNDVSAEVTSNVPTIVAERLMYFHYGSMHLSGGTDVVGEAGPSSHNVYAFAEGYTNSNFDEYLTLQNPNTTAESVAITLFADGTIVQEIKALPAHSRTTVSISAIIYPLAMAYPTTPASRAYEVSMDVQALSGTVVVERPMYFNYNGDTGGTDVLGYTGG